MNTRHYRTLYVDTNLSKGRTILLHLQRFMNVSIRLKLAVIIHYDPIASGKIRLEVIAG